MTGSPLGRLPSSPGLAALVLRVAVGSIILAHGLRKVPDVAGFAGSVATQGLPLPTATAYAVVFIEVVGGALLVLGLVTRLWGLLVALLMAGTSLVVKLDVGLIAGPGQGTGAELDLLLLAGALAVTLIGPGPVSVDELVGMEGPDARGPAPPAGESARGLRRDYTPARS